MPTIWINYGADDSVEEWVEDADWDQQSWDEWDRMEVAHERAVRRRMSPVGDYAGEWRNMIDGGTPPRRPRF